MKFVKVDDTTVRKRRKKLKARWEEFMKMNVKIAKIDLDVGEYASPAVARSVLYRSIKLYGYPIDVMQRGDMIYLIRRDM